MTPAATIAGIGLRAAATTEDLAEALAQALHAPDALAVPADKADHPALAPLAARLPLRAVPVHALALQKTDTNQTHAVARYGAGSVAEACALAAAGPGARLIQPRIICAGGRVTLALATTGEITP